MPRAIDREIELMEASLEHDTAMLRRCEVQWEPYWQRRIAAAQAVFSALVAYRQAIDATPQPPQLSLEA